MKCKSCHTLLPEYGQFEKKVCPNCGAPIVSQSPAAAARPRKNRCVSELLPDLIRRYDRLWKLLLIDNMVFGILLVIIFLLSALSNIGIDIPLPVSAIIIILAFLTQAFFLMALPFLIIKWGQLLHEAEGTDMPAKRQLVKSRGANSVLKLVIACVLCLAVSLSLGFVCFGITQQIAFNNGKAEYTQVEAVITQIDQEEDAEGNTRHTVWISYEYNGQTYPKILYPGYVSTMEVGEQLTVYIDPEAPGETVDNGVLFTVVFSIFAVLLFIPFWFTGPRYLLKK